MSLRLHEYCENGNRNKNYSMYIHTNVCVCEFSHVLCIILRFLFDFPFLQRNQNLSSAEFAGL